MGDLIKRQDVLDIIEENAKSMDGNDAIVWIEKEVKELPTAENEGHWVRWYETKEGEGVTHHIPHCKCSECNCEYDTYSAQFIKYCSKCGAKMTS